MKSLDLEWIVNNWAAATEADRLAAGKETRKRLRATMTGLERSARMLAPQRGRQFDKLARVKELRAQGLGLREAAEVVREETADLPAWQLDGTPEMRQQIRESLEATTIVYRIWAELCPDLEPAWTDLERRALNLHDQLRRDDLTIKDGPS
jgi:hypothetical protein